jgi:DNA processing protein
MNQEQLSIFKLSITPDIGCIRFNRLIEAFGDPQAVLVASIKELMSVEGIGEKTAKSIKDMQNSDTALLEIEKAHKNNIDIILYSDDKYPKPLRNCSDKPLVIYVKGSILDKDFDSIAIVGSRKITNYGLTTTREFASYFAKRGITIVSGLARGVDTQAHISAIENKGRTIAVLGNGLLVNYPPENAKLQDKIPEFGAVISEYPLTQSPDKNTFPRRNRIISGLARVVLVTEAAKNSGALISARYAAEYGKDVFAIPANIYSRMSEGANALIQKGATPVLSPADMGGFLDFIGTESVKEKAKVSLGQKEAEVLKAIEDSVDGIAMDLLIDRLNISVTEITGIIFKLELEDLIEGLAGQVYIRKR